MICSMVFQRSQWFFGIIQASEFGRHHQLGCQGESRSTDQWSSNVMVSVQSTFLVGGWTNPFEKYAQVKLDHETPGIRVKIQKKWKPPPSFRWTCLLRIKCCASTGPSPPLKQTKDPHQEVMFFCVCHIGSTFWKVLWILPSGPRGQGHQWQR